MKAITVTEVFPFMFLKSLIDNMQFQLNDCVACITWCYCLCVCLFIVFSCNKHTLCVLSSAHVPITWSRSSHMCTWMEQMGVVTALPRLITLPLRRTTLPHRVTAAPLRPTAATALPSRPKSPCSLPFSSEPSTTRGHRPSTPRPSPRPRSPCSPSILPMTFTAAMLAVAAAITIISTTITGVGLM